MDISFPFYVKVKYDYPIIVRVQINSTQFLITGYDKDLNEIGEIVNEDTDLSNFNIIDKNDEKYNEFIKYKSLISNWDFFDLQEKQRTITSDIGDLNVNSQKFI